MLRLGVVVDARRATFVDLLATVRAEVRNFFDIELGRFLLRHGGDSARKLGKKMARPLRWPSSCVFQKLGFGHGLMAVLFMVEHLSERTHIHGLTTFVADEEMLCLVLRLRADKPATDAADSGLVL